MVSITIVTSDQNLAARFFGRPVSLIAHDCVRSSRSEIALPLGLEQIVEIHMQMIAGGGYQIAVDRTLDREAVIGALAAALAATAGLRQEQGDDTPPSERLIAA